MDVFREITPLTSNDFFTHFSRDKTQFDFPLHIHDDMEINLILNADGAQRIVGDSIETISEYELVFVGSNLAHGWFTHECKSSHIREVTVQFQKDMLDEGFLNKNQAINIRRMYDNSRRGILFPVDTTKLIAERLLKLNEKRGFDSLLELLSIINDLSTIRDIRLLSDSTFTIDQNNHNSRRIEKVFKYMNDNFHKQISLEDVSRIAAMPASSFSRFIKQRTGFSFVDSLNEIRLGHVSRMLINTTQSIAEIALQCGFNNMANFNRTFKTKKGMTPKEFREHYIGKRIFV